MSTVVFLRFGTDEEVASRLRVYQPSRTRAEERCRLVEDSFPGAKTELVVVDSNNEPTIVELWGLLNEIQPHVVEFNHNSRKPSWHGSTMAYLLLYCKEQGIPMIWWEVDEAQHRPVVTKYRLLVTGWEYVGSLRALDVRPRPAEAQPVGD